MSTASAYVLLEDGTVFEGDSCGADAYAVGEVVFTTGMSGYQESFTDPSFAGQLIAFTYPHIGNYGVSQAAMESDGVWARAAIMREAVNREDSPDAERGWLDWLTDCGIPAITGVDTRALVRHIRDAGAMRGGVFTSATGLDEARALVAAEPTMAGQDLARLVTPKVAHTVGAAPGATKIHAIDTGIKGSIVRHLVARGAQVTLHPCTVTSAELLATDADAFFLANGPGDPAALGYVVDTVRDLVGQRPVWGICLGHQLLCQAVGLDTYKLPFGHRGGNHPVKDLRTGKIEITSQNHGFAVRAPDGTGRVEADEPVRWKTD
ncbi:MAG TPA: glutamine-hydrolyzing carbamoyl-phosphate synthase small subunit, partial [Baekduia sp.]